MFNSNVKSQLNLIDCLEGIEFEKYIGKLLERNGYDNVVITKGTGDFGADIIAEKNGIRYAFQCKRFSNCVGPRAIGEVLRGMNRYKCTRGVVITNNFFTKQAIEEAEISNIELWNRNTLARLLKSFQEENK